MCEIDDLIQRLDCALEEEKAYFGDRLEELIDELRAIRSEYAKREAQYGNQIEQLQQQRLELLEASMVQSAEITTRDGATRKAAIGQVVLFKAHYGGAWTTAIIQEVYGYPPGKVGVRVLGREPQKDRFEYAQYDGGYHAGPTWKWLDE